MRFQHLYDINFFVDSDDRYAGDLTASDFRNALLDHIEGFTDRDWHELRRKPILTVDEYGAELNPWDGVGSPPPIKEDR